MHQALEEVRVIEWGDFISAPYCSKLLADLGADVIKLESPPGDSARHHGPFPGDLPHPEKSGLFLYLNTSKRSVTINPKDPKGLEIFKELLTEADVLVENRSLKEVRDLGLEYNSLKALNPRLILTSITPFGHEGPYSNRSAYDVNLCAMGEVSFCVGEPDKTPLAAPCFHSEFQGGLVGAIGTMLALMAKPKAGKGQHVDISTLDIWCALHPGSKLMNFIYFGGISDHRQGRRREMPYPFTYLPCKDGYVSICTLEDHHWEAFLKIVGDPELLKNPRYHDRRAMGEQYADEVDAKLAPWLMEHTKEEFFSICRRAALPFASVRTTDEVVNCPHLKEREYFVEMEHPVCGTLIYPGAPYKLSKTPWKMNRPAPILGEHNEEVLCGLLGYSRADLVALRQTGAI